MFFELVDGKPRFAKGRITVTEQMETPEGLKKAQRDVYLFTDEEMLVRPEAELIEQPSPEILEKAKKLEGKMLSRSEFEKLLLGTSPDIEQRVSELEKAVVLILNEKST